MARPTTIAVMGGASCCVRGRGKAYAPHRLITRLRVWLTRVPIRDELILMGDLEEQRLLPGRRDELYADGQPLSCKTTGNRNGRKAREIEWHRERSKVLCHPDGAFG